jgi:hypothetical protein
MFWVAIGLKRVNAKLKIKAPASMHNPIKIIQDATFNALKIKSFFFVIIFKI